MVFELSYRGFEVSDVINGRSMQYKIEKDGQEMVFISCGKLMGNLPSVWIILDEGVPNYINVETKQANLVFSDETSKKQAISLYQEVKKLLNVEDRLNSYVPRYSSESEMTPFNVLEIDDASELEKITEGHIN